MTKNEMLAAGLEIINTSKDKKKTKEALAEEFMALLAEYKGSKAKGESTKRAMTVEKDGITYKWCNRHGQYEPIETFGIQSEKEGVITYNPECLIATAQWRTYNSEISKLEKQTMNFIDDVEALREHVKRINELKELRGASGQYDRTGVEGALQESEI